MAQSLEMFHFNPVKFGLIIKQSAKEKGISQATMAARTGLSYDTIGNIYCGKIQKFAFEHMFKICIVLEMSMEVMMLLLLKDEEIDFKDRILLYDTQADDLIPAPEVVPSMLPGLVTEAMADTVTEAAELTKEITEIPGGFFTRDEVNERIDQATRQLNAEIVHLKEVLDLNKAQHEKHVDDLKAQHERHINDLKEQHQNERDTGAKHREWILSVIASVGKGER